MKNVVVTLLSQKPGELKSFLGSFYAKEIINEEGSFKWSCFYDIPYDAIDIITTSIDNNDKFRIETFVTLNNKATLQITDENLDKIIKLFFHTKRG